MLDFISIPFGWLMLQLYNMTNSYGISVILFALFVNILLLPFMMKSKKGMMRTTRLQPEINEIRKKHEGNPQKMNEELRRLYQEAGANPLGGCLWGILPLPIMLALYYAIRQPLTTIMRVPSELLAEGGAIYEKLQALGYNLADYTTSSTSIYEEIYQTKFISANFEQFQGLSDKLIPMNFDFLGLDISATPNWAIWSFDYSDIAIWGPALLLFLIPIISATMSFLSMKISMSMNPQNATNPQAQQTNRTMQLMMPLMSLWIGFIMPAAMGIYWISSSVLGSIRDVGLTMIFSKQMDKEDAERLAKRRERDSELEQKRLETEKLRAVGATEQNRNTSKKKMQATQKQKDDERKAAAEREEREARRKLLGIEEAAKPDSQVGNRRYARGRAYVEDRYSNPETAEEATLLAAEESQYGAAIDESAAEDNAYVAQTPEVETELTQESESASEGEDSGNLNSEGEISN